MSVISTVLDRITERLQIVRNPINRNDRYGALYRSWGYVYTNLIKGGYYEFGLYQGEAFVNSWKINQLYRHWAKHQASSHEQWRREAISDFVDYQHPFYGFDSFEGIPTNTEGNVFFRQGTYAATEESVRHRCDRAAMNYQLHQGFFADVGNQVTSTLAKAAIVNVDCDLYISTVDALRLIAPKLQQGTVVLMDDYNCFSADNTQGERRAMKEFTLAHPAIEFEPWFAYQHVGQAFITHFRKA